MKKQLTILSALLSFLILADVQGPPAPSATGPRTEHRRRRKMITPQQQMEKFGGFVTKEYTGRTFYFMNAQTKVSDSAIEWVQQQIQQVLSLPIAIEKTTIEGNDMFSPMRTAWAKHEKTGAVISIVELPGWTSILLAPEDGWAQVNVSALMKDNPSTEILEKRVKKELWRAFVYLMGGGNSQFEGCLMRPINSLADLDSRTYLAPSPESFNQVIDGAKARGMTPIRRTTYKQACREGWAPAPTNEFQTAIWQQVHEIPKTPMKIEFDAKKGR